VHDDSVCLETMYVHLYMYRSPGVHLPADEGECGGRSSPLELVLKYMSSDLCLGICLVKTEGFRPIVLLRINWLCMVRSS
jgi:hypothetical protein